MALGGVVLFRALFLGGYDIGKDLFLGGGGALSAPLWKRWAMAQGVTTFAGLVCYPIDSVRRRMVMQTGRDLRLAK